MKIGQTLTRPGESPIQANRRLCAEAGIDTLPARFDAAWKEINALAGKCCGMPPAKHPSTCACGECCYQRKHPQLEPRKTSEAFQDEVMERANADPKCAECGEPMQWEKGENSPEIDWVTKSGWHCTECECFLADEEHDTANEI